MSKSTVETIARVLKVLVTVTFVCNLIALPLVPGLVLIGGEGGVPTLLEVMAESGAPAPLIFLAVCWQALWRVWREPYSAMLALFLLFSGVCTAVILWQGRRVLGTVLYTYIYCWRTPSVCGGRPSPPSSSLWRPWSGWCSACAGISPRRRSSPTTPCSCPSSPWRASCASSCPPCSARRRR